MTALAPALKLLTGLQTLHLGSALPCPHPLLPAQLVHRAPLKISNSPPIIKRARAQPQEECGWLIGELVGCLVGVLWICVLREDVCVWVVCDGWLVGWLV